MLLLLHDTVFVIASEMRAFLSFLYIKQFHWVRKVRNITVIFFMFIGRLVASAFASLSGQEQTPRTEQVTESHTYINA